MNQTNVSKLAKDMAKFCQKQVNMLSTSPKKQIILTVVIAAIGEIDRVKGGIWENLPGN